MNDRGLDLSKADLIKNHLFGRAKERLDEVRLRWTEMTGILEAAGDEGTTVKFIRHYWLSKHENVRNRELYTPVKNWARTKAAAAELATSLANDAKFYAALLNPEAILWNRYGDTTRDHVRALRRMGVEQVRPLALSVLRRFADREVRLAFHLFVNWSVRFLIVGGHGGGVLEKVYSDRAIEVEKKSIKTAAQLAKSMANDVPRDDVFQAHFATATVGQPHLARYYLRAIEDCRAGEAHPELVANPNAEKVNLEHILPLNPSREWRIDVREAEGLHQRIGNLALLSATVNRDIGNAQFREKRSAFRDSPFSFTASIASASAWGQEEIEERQMQMAEWAPKTWPLRVW